MGVGDNMSGIVLVMEWTSVLVIILHVSKKKKQKNKKKNPNKTQENKRGTAAQQKIIVQSKLFQCINRSEIKTN